jgi:hypothetical protein
VGRTKSCTSHIQGLRIGEVLSTVTGYRQILRNVAFLDGKARRPVALLCRYTVKKHYIGFPERRAFAIQ